MLRPSYVAMLTAALLIGTAAQAQQAPSGGQQHPPASNANGRGTATGGSGPGRGGVTVIGELPNQVAVSKVEDAEVMGPDHKTLGTVKDLLFDRNTNAVDIVGLALAQEKGRIVVVPWSSLKRAAPSSEVFAADLRPSNLKAAPSFDSAAGRSGYVDVEKQLIGHALNSRQGSRLGTLQDLVIERGSGAVDLAIVDTGQFGLGTGHFPKALPWKELDQTSLGRNGPLVVNATPQTLAQASLFGAKAKLRSTEPSPEQTFKTVQPTGTSRSEPVPRHTDEGQ